MTALTIRQEIADSIDAVLGDDWTVYPAPVDLIALPAAVLVPGNPYWTPARFADGNVTEGLAVHLDVQLIVGRAEVDEGLADLETAGVAVGLAIASNPVCRWVDMSGVEPIEVNSLPAIFARVGVIARV